MVWKGRLLSTETLEVIGYVTLVNRFIGRVQMYIRPEDDQDIRTKRYRILAWRNDV
jgi:hypothetical protein